MVNKLLRFIAPHHCYGCQKIGSVLCDNCKHDIIEDGFDGCIVCSRPSSVGVCLSCRTAYERAWCVGERSGALERTIDAFKFERVIDAAAPLAGLLDSRMPVLPNNVVVVPVPTLSRHVRQRGYDHIHLVAKEFAIRRSLKSNKVIRRTNNGGVQRGNTKARRMEQAKRAFYVDGVLDPDATYLVIDDVVTTNATLRYAAQSLRDAGARHVWVAVIARQPLDKSA